MLDPMAADLPALADRVAFLRSLCGRGDEAIETHFAWLFLVGDRAYKLRKPVVRDPMDYRTLEARRRGSIEEVRLNRRLAPGVYLDAVPLTSDADGRLAIAGPGTAVDWLVCMRRLDRTRLLDARLMRGEDVVPRLEPVARLLAEFYRSAAPAITDGDAFVARLARQVAANHAVLAAAGRPHADVLRDTQLQLITRVCDVLAARATRGCIVEAHGDLRPEHVFLDAPPSIIDCLEFDRDLRLLDRAEELSFLELECARLGHAEAGAQLRRRWLALLDDDAPPRLLAFYRSHRGATRAKLYTWRAAEPDGGDESQWLARADDYVGAALSDAGLGLA